MGYTTWVEEVWVNYLSNAMKYGGRPPQIDIGATPLDNGMIRFWVKDNGDGIPPEKLPELFTRFKRLNTLRATGHGLGLSIVKGIVEKLGGEVGVESENVPGKGSVFSFTLPARAEE
jgi:signal transduction histidine kinase